MEFIFFLQSMCFLFLSRYIHIYFFVYIFPHGVVIANCSLLLQEAATRMGRATKTTAHPLVLTPVSCTRASSRDCIHSSRCATRGRSVVVRPGVLHGVKERHPARRGRENKFPPRGVYFGRGSSRAIFRVLLIRRFFFLPPALFARRLIAPVESAGSKIE